MHIVPQIRVFCGGTTKSSTGVFFFPMIYDWFLLFLLLNQQIVYFYFSTFFSSCFFALARDASRNLSSVAIIFAQCSKSIRLPCALLLLCNISIFHFHFAQKYIWAALYYHLNHHEHVDVPRLNRHENMLWISLFAYGLININRSSAKIRCFQQMDWAFERNVNGNYINLIFSMYAVQCAHTFTSHVTTTTTTTTPTTTPTTTTAKSDMWPMEKKKIVPMSVEKWSLFVCSYPISHAHWRAIHHSIVHNVHNFRTFFFFFYCFNAIAAFYWPLVC